MAPEFEANTPTFSDSQGEVTEVEGNQAVRDLWKTKQVLEGLGLPVVVNAHALKMAWRSDALAKTEENKLEP